MYVGYAQVQDPNVYLPILFILPLHIRKTHKKKHFFFFFSSSSSLALKQRFSKLHSVTSVQKIDGRHPVNLGDVITGNSRIAPWCSAMFPFQGGGKFSMAGQQTQSRHRHILLLAAVGFIHGHPPPRCGRLHPRSSSSSLRSASSSAFLLLGAAPAHLPPRLRSSSSSAPLSSHRASNTTRRSRLLRLHSKYLPVPSGAPPPSSAFDYTTSPATATSRTDFPLQHQFTAATTQFG